MSTLTARLTKSLVCAAAALLLLVPASACSSVDLSSTLEVTEVTSGYYDAGVTDLGASKLVPSISLRLKNLSTDSISSVNMAVFFWGEEYDEPKELDEVLITAIGRDGIAPGATSEPILVRSRQGFTLEEQPRSELFNHRKFRDVTAKVFLRHTGAIVPFGEFTIERRVLLSAPTDILSR